MPHDNNARIIPIAVEVTRGDMVESRHRVSGAVADATGRIVHAWGDVDRPIYPRSANKPLQAIALIESGAADRFALSDAELALACASHAGEPMHSEAVTGWLARLGLGEADLECGRHAPSHQATAEALFAAGEAPTQIHNNCSGKHCGFLTTARHLGEPTAGYIDAGHPVQQRLRQVMAALSGIDLSAAPVGIDGCSIPTIGLPLSGLATAFARFADPSGLAPERAAAIGRIQRAMAAHPEMVSGTGRFNAALIAESSGSILAKTGAEGVYSAAVPALGLGIAIKVDDGAGRAAEVAIGAVLRWLGAIDDNLAARLSDHLEAPLINRAGRHIGDVRATSNCPPRN